MKNLKYILLFIFIELVLAGLGMGVPFFLILFGFFVGIFLANKNFYKKNCLRVIFKYSLLTSMFTFIMMVIIWMSYFVNIFDRTFDIANSGIPMILYNPLPSFIAWLILMIFISPFLQLLMTIFGAYLRLILLKR